MRPTPFHIPATPESEESMKSRKRGEAVQRREAAEIEALAAVETLMSYAASANSGAAVDANKRLCQLITRAAEETEHIADKSYGRAHEITRCKKVIEKLNKRHTRILKSNKHFRLLSKELQSLLNST